VFVPPNKVTFFFSDYFAQGIAWYERFFAGAAHVQAKGEVCHDYLASAPALHRIHNYRPDMRLICCLRNPYERALSSWRFFGRNGMDQPTLAAQGERNPSVFEQSHYATQLTLVQSLFPREQLLIFFFEELATEPESVARRLYEFIGVDKEFIPPSLRQRVNVNAKPRLRLLARFAQFVHEQSWKRSRHMSNLIGHIKRVRPLRRFVRAALYRELRDSSGWRDHLGEFPEQVVRRYEWEISLLERMTGEDLRHWHALPETGHPGDAPPKAPHADVPFEVAAPSASGNPSPASFKQPILHASCKEVANDSQHGAGLPLNLRDAPLE
jgi:hypothetical protein